MTLFAKPNLQANQQHTQTHGGVLIHTHTTAPSSSLQFKLQRLHTINPDKRTALLKLLGNHDVHGAFAHEAYPLRC